MAGGARGRAVDGLPLAAQLAALEGLRGIAGGGGMGPLLLLNETGAR